MADGKRDAFVELTIRDLKDQALQHSPTGQFNANSEPNVLGEPHLSDLVEVRDVIIMPRAVPQMHP